VKILKVLVKCVYISSHVSVLHRTLEGWIMNKIRLETTAVKIRGPTCNTEVQHVYYKRSFIVESTGYFYDAVCSVMYVASESV
jgi:hypothetical protein